MNHHNVESSNYTDKLEIMGHLPKEQNPVRGPIEHLGV